MDHALRVWVNGQPHQVVGAEPHTTLLNWLRDRGLTGVKEGCAEGECGACAVLLSRSGATGVRAHDDNTDGTPVVRWDSVNSCLVTLAAINGQAVITAEGLVQGDRLHPVQEAMAANGSSQCGYCTPGFVTSMAAEYHRPGRVDGQHGTPNGFDPHALSGNLCRCTGYRPIVDAAHSLGRPDGNDLLVRRLAEAAPQPLPLHLESVVGTFDRPASLAEALELLQQDPEAKVLGGGTDWNVEVNIRHSRASHVIAVDTLPELCEFEWADDHVLLGAGLHLSDIERLLEGRIPLFDQLFPQFASRLIRNSATLGTASPIGDGPPVLLALEATLVLAGLGGEREVAVADFFTGYRTTLRRPDELIRAVKVPLPLAPLSAFHKVTKRRYDDISSVAVAFALELDGDTVRAARIGLGGVAATPLRAPATEAALEGRPWNQKTVEAAAEVLREEGSPISDQRASAEYRRAMLGESLRKFYFDAAPTEPTMGVTR